MTMRRENGREPTENDKAIGLRLRVRRLELNKSQLDIAQALGVAPQQVQKYERGANRITCGTIKDLDPRVARPNARRVAKSAQIKQAEEILATQDGQDLVRLFAAIKTPATRKKVVTLLQAISEADGVTAPRPKRR